MRWIRPPIDLCLSVFPWAPFRATKAAVKLHTLLDLRGPIPRGLHVSAGHWHDVNMPRPSAPRTRRDLRHGPRLSGFRARLLALQQAGAFFVTRAKANTKTAPALFGPERPARRAFLCDQTVVLTGPATHQKYPLQLRRVRFRDHASQKTLVFLTNLFGPAPTTICALYKARWQVELFFKWVKQHLRITRFYGTSENGGEDPNLGGGLGSMCSWPLSRSASNWISRSTRCSRFSP